VSRDVEFRRELDELYRRRTHWLRHAVSGTPIGAPPKLSRNYVNEAITTLQRIASDALATKLARTEFSRRVKKVNRWHIKQGSGWGVSARQRTFKLWYKRHVKRRHCIYVFSGNGRCIYVGKTTNGASRVAAHFDKFWFPRVTRIDVYAVSGKGSLPILECLAIHRFQPQQNKSRAESKKWTSRCPLCALHRDIESELHAIFRFR